ncbi:SDR family NAD(P)-dependent oxidoreductase [Pseudalkalibacillus sp. A8]|uniref:SDR family NAD(P)-dependent oxidoreductase n=1 Tax=Pseudalkalibacillus sp. A8 TaxID=3382641 RepID=UPI0038B622AB
MMFRFEEKVAVVTGAGQGIGEASAKQFADEGAKVAILDMNKEGAERVASNIRNDGGEVIALTCDVTNGDDVKKCFEVIDRKFGRIDILVNNAGITRDSLLFKMSDNDWDSVIQTHLKGAFLCSREAQKYMVQQKYGKIVMLSSRSALGNRGQTNYSAAKAGLQGMTRTMAIELGPFGINVNAVAPGFIETDMTKAISEKTGIPYEEIKNNAIEANSIKRVGTPQDVSNAIAFLSSDESSFITGQILYVAGKTTV